MFTKYHNNDPNLRNLLSSDRTINIMMLAALRKKKKKKKTSFSPVCPWLDICATRRSYPRHVA